MEAFLGQKQKQQECTVPISQLSASSSGAPCSSALARFSVEPEGAQLRFHHESEARDVIQVDIPTAQEEELYDIEIPLSFKASVGSRIHGLACWFDALFDGSLHKDALLLLLVHLEPTSTSFRYVLSQPICHGWTRNSWTTPHGCPQCSKLYNVPNNVS